MIETKGAEFCLHHFRLSDEYGAEMARRGAVPKKRARRVVEDLPVVTATTNAIPPGAIAPASVPVTAKLAEVPDLLARVAAIERLLDDALGRLRAEEPRLP